MNRLYRYTPEFILLGYILIFIGFKNPGRDWDRVINSDGKGYYAYLPAIFIYHDLDYRFVEYYENRYYPADRSVFKEFRVNVNGKTVNKCFPGLAILWLPFFLAAHALSYILDYPTDGYSIIYQYSIALAALFYLWLGCRFLFILLRKCGGSEKLAAFIVFLLASGTNLIFYSIIEGSMAHVYSFAIITLFLFSTVKLFEKYQGRWIIFSSFLFALIVLTRPTNGLVLLLVPVMASITSSFKRGSMIPFRFSPTGTGKNKSLCWPLAGGILIFLLLISIPFLLWHFQTGHWIIYTYGNERFDFTNPHFFSILFSYNRGWFVYTPMAFISLFGFIEIYRRGRAGFFLLLAFLLTYVYGASCWWMWYYASKCGQRIFIDMYAMIAILLLFLFLGIHQKKFTGKILAVFLFLLTILNLLQFYQHSKWIFPPVEIDRRMFWESFFTLYPTARVHIPESAIIAQKSYFNDLETRSGWMNEGTIRDSIAFSGHRSSFIDRYYPYSIGLSAEVDTLFKTRNRIIRVTAWIFSVGPKTGSSMVVDFDTGGKSISYHAFYFENFARSNKWTKVECAFYVPRELPLNASVKIYVFNPPGMVPVFIDDMNIDFLSLKDLLEFRKIEGLVLPVK